MFQLFNSSLRDIACCSDRNDSNLFSFNQASPFTYFEFSEWSMPVLQETISPGITNGKWALVGQLGSIHHIT